MDHSLDKSGNYKTKNLENSLSFFFEGISQNLCGIFSSFGLFDQ